MHGVIPGKRGPPSLRGFLVEGDLEASLENLPQCVHDGRLGVLTPVAARVGEGGEPAGAMLAQLCRRVVEVRGDALRIPVDRLVGTVLDERCHAGGVGAVVQVARVTLELPAAA